MSQPSRQEPLAQRLPLEQLHGDEVPAFVLVDVVDGADVRVVERGRGARLAAEAFDRQRVAHELWRQQLEGHVAAETQVLSLVDSLDPAFA